MPRTPKAPVLRLPHCLLILLALPTIAHSQDQAIYFDGYQYAAFDSVQNRPFRSPTGTIELWIKVDRPGVLLQRARPQTQAVLDFTAAHCANLPLRILLARNHLALFLGYEQRNEQLPDLLLPDDQWHFLAITYDGLLLTVYLDGDRASRAQIMKGMPEQALTRPQGRCHLGGSPRERSSFRGAIDNLALWNTPRTPAQVRTDMTGFPRLEATTGGLVAMFDFSEGRGVSFRDRSGKLAGSHPSARWTTPLASNPTLLSEGIWFVIQNRTEVKDDTVLPARRIALRTNGPQDAPSMASLPAAGTPDEFLWRVRPTGDRFRLHNKQLGDEFALTLFQGEAVMMPSNDNWDSQKWAIRPWDIARGGVNTFVLTSTATTPASALSARAGTFVPSPMDLRSATQAWLFQPMYLLGSYHIGLPSAPPPLDPPFTKALALPHGFLLRATNTVSDWAVLNAHNIYSNMFAAIVYQGPLGAEGLPEKRSVTMISKYDDLATVCHYPDIKADCEWVKNFRGFGGQEGDARTLITEELMCNVLSNAAYSEFDQVVHEFSHTLDGGLFNQARISKVNRGTYWVGYESEWFPNRVQQWFNSRHINLSGEISVPYGTPNSVTTKYTRGMLLAHEEPQDESWPIGKSARLAGGREYLAAFFVDGEEYWAPPRCLAGMPSSTPGSAGGVPGAEAQEAGWYKLKTEFQGDGKCLESNQITLPPSSLIAGTMKGVVFKGASFMDHCQNVGGQAWRFVPEDSGGYYRLKSRLHDDKCLEVDTLGPTAVLGGAAFMADCGDVPGQLWRPVPAGTSSGYYNLQSKAQDSKCLEGNQFEFGDENHQGPAFMNGCSAEVTDQHWKFVEP